jgi:hypothetical protein
MVSIRPFLSVVLAASLALSFALASTPASAKKKKKHQQPVEQQQPPEDSPDVIFAKSLVGKAYDDELSVEGWDEIDGGLVAPPVYVHRYQREDGTYLVLTSRELKKATKTEPASYVVADALIVPKPQSDMQFSIACVLGKDQTLNFMGEAKARRQGVVDRCEARLADLARDRRDRLGSAQRASAAPMPPGASRSTLMKATLEGKVIAASDDIVEQGGYAYFPNEHVGSSCLRRRRRPDRTSSARMASSSMTCARRRTLRPRRLGVTRRRVPR